MPTVVAPLAGAWVEIQLEHLLNDQEEVAPLAGAWVEMQSKSMADWKRMAVAPLAGAWVEINKSVNETVRPMVAPLAGAWVEIKEWRFLENPHKTSLPSRERGLKLLYVTTLWFVLRRSPRGSVG